MGLVPDVVIVLRVLEAPLIIAVQVLSVEVPLGSVTSIGNIILILPF